MMVSCFINFKKKNTGKEVFIVIINKMIIIDKDWPKATPQSLNKAKPMIKSERLMIP